MKASIATLVRWTGPRPSGLGMDGIVHELEAAGLLTVRFDADGVETWTLTPEGVQVANQLAMGDEATFNAIPGCGQGRESEGARGIGPGAVEA